MKYLPLIFIIISPLLQAESASEKLMKAYLDGLPKVERDLYEALKGVAKKNDITHQEVTDLFKQKLLNSAYWPSCGKGSYADLGNDAFIKTKSLKNEISYEENGLKKIWVGENLASSELLIMEDGDIKYSYKTETTNKNFQFFLFEPKRVSYFDWGTISGGYYERNCK